MHRIITTAACAATLGLGLLAGTSAQAADVGVSINIQQPGVYGRVDIGRFPQPVLYAPRPVIVTHRVVREPVYLWVPPGHRQNWRRHCGRYDACGAPVYFVQDRWYHDHVMAPRYVDNRHHRHHRHDRRDDRYDRHHRHDDHPGRGHGRGHGHGHRD